MPKKTTILIVILAIITGILIFLAVKSDQSLTPSSNNGQTSSKPSPTVTQPYATLAFSVAQLDISKISPNQSVDIVLNTNGKSVSGAQVELTYDPKVFTGITLSQPKTNPLFGPTPVVLINSVDPTQGRISYAVAISGSDQEKTGTGSIVTLTFTANKSAGVPQSQISFLPKSAVTTLTTAGSVLSASTPLQVILTPIVTVQPLGY